MPPEAAGEVAFVTGAAGGLGRAVVARLRERGMRVFATDVALAALPCTDPDFAATSLDVTSESAVNGAVAECVRQFGRLDHVVHLAGRAGKGPIDAVTLADWRALLDVNLTSAFVLAKAAHRHLAATRGSLVLTASSNAINGGSALSGPAYAVSKAGLINLARYLAKEWGAEGIRVNCLAPGPIDTPMVSGRFDGPTIERMRATIPLGRIGRPEEVAGAVAYLTSADAAFQTGTVINLSGGLVLD
jgi:NAD(P)-dependent dehydrogenase (short-subunit alcohol dehydrogenase family)